MDEKQLAENLIQALTPWIENIIKKVISGTPTIPVDPDIPSLVKCQDGPVVKSVRIISEKEIEVTFHGVEVHQAKLQVKNLKGELIGVEEITLMSNSPRVKLTSPLGDRTYILQFSATSCLGEDFYKFNGITGELVSVESGEPCGEIIIKDIQLK